MSKIILPEDIKLLLDRYRAAYEAFQRIKKEVTGRVPMLTADEIKSDEELLLDALIRGIAAREFMIESERKILRKIEENLHETAKETDTLPERDYPQP